MFPPDPSLRPRPSQYGVPIEGGIGNGFGPHVDPLPDGGGDVGIPPFGKGGDPNQTIGIEPWQMGPAPSRSPAPPRDALPVWTAGSGAAPGQHPQLPIRDPRRTRRALLSQMQG